MRGAERVNERPDGFPLRERRKTFAADQDAARRIPPPRGKKQRLTFEMGPTYRLRIGDSGGPTVVVETGNVSRVSSAMHPPAAFGIRLPDDYGNVVKRRYQLVTQIKVWAP